MSLIVILGFALAAYSVIANDVIQTLGTFISSNSKKPWYYLWIFSGSILAATLIYGWVVYNGDVSYGRLVMSKTGVCGGEPCTQDNPSYPFITDMSWWFLLPPLVLLVITRLGIPVSTSFLILTFFKPKGLGDMVVKSLSGYAVALITGYVLYLILSPVVEKYFARTRDSIGKKEIQVWTILQWVSTGYLWSLWLVQDFANIYVYMPRFLDLTTMLISLFWLLALLGFVFWSKGGAIQGIVNSKTGTSDVRSATIIDFTYGSLMFLFSMTPVPMSTTWLFLGLLAGRELGIRTMIHRKLEKKITFMILRDAGKAGLGLVISIVLVWFINFIRTGSLYLEF
jgi:hypothetical protein